jgi:hypothetical protein
LAGLSRVRSANFLGALRHASGGVGLSRPAAEDAKCGGIASQSSDCKGLATKQTSGKTDFRRRPRNVVRSYEMKDVQNMKVQRKDERRSLIPPKKSCSFLDGATRGCGGMLLYRWTLDVCVCRMQARVSSIAECACCYRRGLGGKYEHGCGDFPAMQTRRKP